MRCELRRIAKKMKQRISAPQVSRAERPHARSNKIMGSTTRKHQVSPPNDYRRNHNHHHYHHRHTSNYAMPNLNLSKSIVPQGRPPTLRAALLVTLAISVLVAAHTGVASGQCPKGTMTTFERIGGVTIKDAQLSILYQANVSQATIGHHHHHLHSHQHSHSTTGAGSSNSTATLYHISTPITAECNNRCRKIHTCRAFLVDYGRHTCWSVDHQIGGGGGGGGGGSGSGQVAPVSSFATLDRAPTPIHLVPTGERTAYFEKVCLNSPIDVCERAWIFERVLSYHIPGHDDKIIDDVASRLKCQEHCFSERTFRCRSGEYDHLTMQCRLSTVDRHMKQALFRPTANNVDYFENQCAPAKAQCEEFDRYEDMDLGRAEIMRQANNSEQCQQFCTQTIKAFICRSFTWSPLTGRCYLNSVNTFMVGGQDRLLAAPGLVYYQRNECIDLKLECDTNAMTLQLRTNEPFRGRMYVRDDPNACETLGRSALLSSLSIPFQSPMGRCAQRELPSRYSSVVVVQQHPLIQRKSDRYIKLVCDFQTANRTITSAYNVMANPWTSTALINATSHAPKILLRITDKFGNDITGAKLGDELQLRIEAETESVYDMVARSVIAKSGTPDESIVLIDRDGCPADSRIFPPLRKLNKRTIIGRFDAFKFSSDVVVRFQVDVQFCLNSCPPTNCLDPHNAASAAGTASGSGSLFNVNSQQLGYDSAAAGAGSGESPAATIGSQQVVTSNAPPLNADGQADSPNSLTLGAGNEYAPRSTTYRPPTGSNSGAGGGGQPDASITNALSAVEYSGDSIVARRGQQPVNQPSMQTNINSQSPTSDQLFDSQATKDAGSRHLAAPGDQQHPTFRPHQHHQPYSVQQQQQQQQQQQMMMMSKMQQYNKQMYNSGADSGQAGGGAASDLAAAELSQQQQQQDSQNSHSSKRRRRRSTEPLPPTPKHVPLQREIIVIESSSDPPAVKSTKQSGNKSASARSQRDMKTVAGPGPSPSSATNMMRGQEQDTLNVNKYDSHGPQQLGRAGELETTGLDSSGSLVCTTWTSLGLSLAAFCALQLLSVGLCLASWTHNRKSKQTAARQRPIACIGQQTTTPGRAADHHMAGSFGQSANQSTQHKLLFDGRQQFF